jgi:hypothetical protein
MSYLSWYIKSQKKYNILISSLQKRGFSKKNLIEYFRFENLSIKQSFFCPLFAKNKKCHNIANLNCYMCACDNFRLTTSGRVKSYCRLNLGHKIESKGKIHQDCSKCSVPHKKRYIEKAFKFKWNEMFLKTYKK